MTHRNAAVATSDLFHAVTKLTFVLRADSNLSAPAVESKAEKLDSFCSADAALLVMGKIVPPTLWTKVPPVVTFTENRVGGGKFLP